ncbi:hypothetical protein D3C87_1180090 [compost metagenome]
MASEPYRAETLPRTTSIWSIWSGRILASCAVPPLAPAMRTPSTRISTWLELAPRMNSVVLAPMPPVVANSTPAWPRSSERRSGAWALTMSSWVTTVVCGSASVTACAVREAVTTTGASVWPGAAPLASGAVCAWTMAGRETDEKTAMAARMAGTSGRTGGCVAAVGLWSEERMLLDGWKHGRARSPAGHMAKWRAAVWSGAPAFRPVSGLTTSGRPPSRSVDPRHMAGWISGMLAGPCAAHGACAVAYRCGGSTGWPSARRAPDSLFPVELRPCGQGREHLERARV